MEKFSQLILGDCLEAMGRTDFLENSTRKEKEESEKGVLTRTHS